MRNCSRKDGEDETIIFVGTSLQSTNPLLATPRLHRLERSLASTRTFRRNSSPDNVTQEDVDGLLLRSHQVGPIGVKITRNGGTFAAYLDKQDVKILLKRLKKVTFKGCEVSAFSASAPRNDDGSKRRGAFFSLPLCVFRSRSSLILTDCRNVALGQL